MKTIVIGAGGAGCQAARFLAQAGREVLVLERFTLDHDQGSSYGESRIIRKTYPDRLYTRLMGDAYPLWEALQEEAGESLFVRCGGLYLGRPDNPDILAVEDALKAHGVPYERLSAAESGARFPGYRLKEDEVGIVQAESGFLRASACLLAAARSARRHGAEIRERTCVRRFLRDGSGFRVETDAGDFAADRLILTAGPWLADFIPSLNQALRITQQQYVYLRPKSPADAANFQPGRFPVWIQAAETRAEHAAAEAYGFPMDGRVEGVKFAYHTEGPLVHADRVTRDLRPEVKQELLAYAAERMPGLSSEITYSKTCLYSNTPDHHFILDTVPGCPGAFCVGGCSGHAYKFLILQGRIAADAAMDRKSPYDLSRFRIARFPV